MQDSCKRFKRKDYAVGVCPVTFSKWVVLKDSRGNVRKGLIAACLDGSVQCYL